VEIINFIENHWKLISFIVTEIGFLILFGFTMVQALKCLLRNDILAIYDRCKDKGEITYWQLDSLERSFKIYAFFKGNSFVEGLMKKARGFKIVD
jgi:hypothetical protein